MANKILIVDDDEVFRSELRDSFQNHKVIEASSGEEALKLLRRANDIGVVILDVFMSGMNGIDVLEEIKKTDPQLRIIILTGYSSKDTAIEALKAHADDYIEKPINVKKISGVVESLLKVEEGEADVNSLNMRGKMERVQSFIEKNFHKKTCLNDAAQIVYLSPKYLSRIFKQYTGLGFSDYKLKIKMKHAKDLLVKFGYNVNQVSEKLGYENAESFIRQFKKITRYTPMEYRKKMQKNKSMSLKKNLA